MEANVRGLCGGSHTPQSVTLEGRSDIRDTPWCIILGVLRTYWSPLVGGPMERDREREEGERVCVCLRVQTPDGDS